MNASIRSGGCACSAVRYRVTGPLRDVFYCHCDSCRRQSGHFMAATKALRSDVEVTGEAHLNTWQATEKATRQFCNQCGSHVFWRIVGSENLWIFAGSLDKPSGLHVSRHIYVSEKSDYYDIVDGLPQHELD